MGHGFDHNVALSNHQPPKVSAAADGVRVMETWYAAAQQPSLIVHELEFTNLDADDSLCRWSPNQVSLGRGFN